MRVLVLTNSDIGLYKFRQELLEKLCCGHEVYVALPSGEFISALENIGCKFIPFEFDRRGMNPVKDINQILRYIKAIKRIKPDVVLTYTIKPNVYGGIACQIRKVPYIANVTGLGTSIENGGLIGYISTSLYRLGLKRAQCVFFQNKDNQKLFKDKKIVKGNAELIPGSGVNLNTHCLEAYPSDEFGIKFLFIGRIMKDKGIDELLQAMEILHKKYPNISLDIVGGFDEDYENVIKAACSDGYIRYHGQQKEVHQYIKQSHCTVLPSYHEGMANVMLEASSTGRPVITTRVPGCVETFDEGVSGIGCDAHDIKSLVSAMERLICMSNEERKKMGQRGREKMENEYDRNLIIAAYLCQITHIQMNAKVLN